MFEIIGIIRIAIAFFGTGIGTYFDVFNKKNVPDLFLYGFLAISLIINIFDPMIFIDRLPVGILLIALLYALYRIGQVGGADVIIIAAIFCALPTIQQPLLYGSVVSDLFKLPSILSILAMSILLFAIYIIVRYLPLAIKKTIKGKVKFNMINVVASVALLVAYIFLISTMVQLLVYVSIPYLIFVTFIVFLVIFFTLYKDTIMESMIKWRKRVEKEDVIALERIPMKLIKKYRLGRLVTTSQLKRMKKLKRKWPILDLPYFLPYIFAALILYILFGDSLLYLM